MEKIAIFASGAADASRRVATLFYEGNRIHVDLFITDTPCSPAIDAMKAAGAEVVELAEGFDADMLAGILAEKQISLLALDAFSQPLPAPVATAFGDRTVSLSSAEEAPREVVAALAANLQAASTPPPVPRSEEKSVNEEWAETLKINYDEHSARQSSLTTPPPIPGQAASQASEPAGPNPEVGHTPGTSAPTGGPLRDNHEPMPSTYLIWSVLCTVFCCFVPGIVAIVFSSQVSSRYFAGDIEGSRRASRRAQVWILVSFVLGVLSATLYLPIMLFS